MEVMEHYHYTKEHEWIFIEDGIGTVGLTEFAQSSLGEITYIELPDVGAEFEQFEQFASVESVKAASDIYCPMSGRVVEVNGELNEDPGLINRDSYEKGWIARVELANPDETSKLMTADEYRNYLATLETAEDPDED